jgi:ABC-type antimicrobial peptide transport system permease subunit
VLATIAPEVATAPAVRLEDLVADELAPERFAAALLGAFAGVALILSGLGLFSVLALRSRVRRAEAGIRLALGAESEDLRRSIVIPGIGLTLVGVAGGAVVAAWIAGLLQGVVPTAAPVDPEALGLAAVALLAVGGVAAWFPAHRTARMDPASALRDE